MRRILLLLVPLVAGGALVLACENDSSSGGGTFAFEAGTFDGPGVSDAPAPDAEPPPKASGVTVSVTRAGLPAAGIGVVFHDAAGAVLQTVMTGSDGKATSTVGGPAMASALLGGRGVVTNRRVVTWIDVKAGDVLSAVDLVDPAGVGEQEDLAGSVGHAPLVQG